MLLNQDRHGAVWFCRYKGKYVCIITLKHLHGYENICY